MSSFVGRAEDELDDVAGESCRLAATLRPRAAQGTACNLDCFPTMDLGEGPMQSSSSKHQPPRATKITPNFNEGMFQSLDWAPLPPKRTCPIDIGQVGPLSPLTPKRQYLLQKLTINYSPGRSPRNHRPSMTSPPDDSPYSIGRRPRSATFSCTSTQFQHLGQASPFRPLPPRLQRGPGGAIDGKNATAFTSQSPPPRQVPITVLSANGSPSPAAASFRNSSESPTTLRSLHHEGVFSPVILSPRTSESSREPVLAKQPPFPEIKLAPRNIVLKYGDHNAPDDGDELDCFLDQANAGLMKRQVYSCVRNLEEEIAGLHRNDAVGVPAALDAKLPPPFLDLSSSSTLGTSLLRGPSHAAALQGHQSLLHMKTNQSSSELSLNSLSVGSRADTSDANTDRSNFATPTAF